MKKITPPSWWREKHAKTLASQPKNDYEQQAVQQRTSVAVASRAFGGPSLRRAEPGELPRFK